VETLARPGSAASAKGDVRPDDRRPENPDLALFVASVEDHAIFMLDTGGFITSWNPGGERLNGYRADEIIGRHFGVLYPSEDVAAGKPARELATAASEGRLEDEGWRVRRNGTRFWANVVITALRDPGGSLRGYGKITRDLTERRAAELALGASEERFRRSFDEAGIGMMILGIDGRYERVNDAFCALVGYRGEQLVGLSHESITHSDDVAADARLERALLARDASSFATEKRYLHASGHTVLVSISVTLIRDADGRPLHFIAQVQDITERRRNERLLAHMADHDPLTGLLNRRGFQRELASHLARIARYGATGALLILDLDNFKDFNDTRGHSAGDELIVSLAQALRARMRESDVIARLGGDEFAVLLPNGDEAAAQHVADAVLWAVRDLTIPPLTRERSWVTASVGIARFETGRHPVAEEIMAEADFAMYAAKKAGGNRWSDSPAGGLGGLGGPEPARRAKTAPAARTKRSRKKLASSAAVPQRAP
jgi:diguanylate cyclase (GGDEF)-like protein/PAS domain S-box-containing protein